jgi:OOP family OmpA-OmpF porin
MIIIISMSALNFPALAGAEMKEGSVEISPFFGYCTGSTSRDLCHKDVYGLRLGYTFTPVWEIEGTIEGVGSSSATMYHADVLYHFMPEKSLNPFVIAGIGGAHVRPRSGSPYDTVMGNIGVGFKYWFSENIAFRTEIRDVMTHSQNSVVTAGLTFSFGGKTPKSALATPPQPPAQQPEPEKKVGPISPAPEAKAEAVPPAPETKVEPMPAPVPAPVKVILEDIHFDFNNASLTPVAREILNKNVQIIKENPGITVQIEGHACAHGPAGYNMILSERRVNAVKEYLVNQGISGDRLTTIAYGETRLAVPEIPTKKNKHSKEAKANRRVHFEVIVK